MGRLRIWLCIKVLLLAALAGAPHAFAQAQPAQTHAPAPQAAPADKGGTAPRKSANKVEGWVGIVPRGSSIGSVLEGSPAMAAGLYFDDEIVALDGFKCDAAGLVNRVEDKKPGDTVRVTLFRRDRLLELPVTVAAKPADGVYLQRVEGATEAQKAAYQAWLGAPWNELDSLNAVAPKV